MELYLLLPSVLNILLHILRSKCTRITEESTFQLSLILYIQSSPWLAISHNSHTALLLQKHGANNHLVARECCAELCGIPTEAYIMLY